MNKNRCDICTEPETSQVHRNIDPKAVRGPWDIPHHIFRATPLESEWVRRARESRLPVKEYSL